MTITTLLIIIGIWVISAFIAWTLFTVIMKGYMMKHYSMTISTALAFRMKAGEYTHNAPVWLEWIRFFVWPYGIVQRIIVTKRLCEMVMNETYEN